VGGPDTTGPLGDSAAEFLRVFLDHCAHQSNYATSKTGAPLDFVSFHAKGTPTVENGHVQMGIRNQLAAIQRGFEIVTSFPEWRNTPIILGESDPEGCAACSAQKHPESAYRNGPRFAAYTAAILNHYGIEMVERCGGSLPHCQPSQKLAQSAFLVPNQSLNHENVLSQQTKTFCAPLKS